MAPGVVYLASKDCNLSGIILRADDGRFSVVTLRTSDEVAFDHASLTPEAVGDWLERALRE
ncbi:MAG: hypothetical protein ACREH3_01430 [Geminicoccales bacterium]